MTEQFQSAHLKKTIPGVEVWKLNDISRHAKSGQVFCTLQRNHDQPPNGGHSDDASMKDAAPRDKLQQWLDEHGPSMAPFQPRQSQPQPASPPYPFTVQTLPAHESALDPQVHKLYFLYQTKVHQDADPFTCDLSKPHNNSSNN